MKTQTSNYINTFIEVAEDCPVSKGEQPPVKGASQTVASMQFDMIFSNPYKFTSDDVLFQVYAIRNNLKRNEYNSAKEQFFSKGQPCFRASPLTKRYGWGVHSDKDGKIAIYGCETTEYKRLAKDKTLKVVKAMKSVK